MKRVLIAIAVGILVAGCATGPRAPSSETVARGEATGPVFRHLAWMEGNLQTAYEPDRQVAEAKLQKWEGKIPAITETEEYLNYLSVLSASGKPESEKRIKEYLAKYPGEKRAVFLLAVQHLRAKKKELAGYLLGQLEKDAEFPWKSLVYNNLGLLALNDKNRGLALDYFEKAVKASPPTAAPFVNLGALYLQSKSYADAERMFKKAHGIDGEFEDAVLGWGSALEGQGKFEDAHKVYANFIEDNPDALSVLYNDSLVLGNRLKQREAAAQQLLRYIQRGGRETAKAHEFIQNWR